MRAESQGRLKREIWVWELFDGTLKQSAIERKRLPSFVGGGQVVRYIPATDSEQKLTPADHKARHMALHTSLDELIADWILHTDGRPSTSTVIDLMSWSATQIQKPTELPDET